MLTKVLKMAGVTLILFVIWMYLQPLISVIFYFTLSLFSSTSVAGFAISSTLFQLCDFAFNLAISYLWFQGYKSIFAKPVK